MSEKVESRMGAVAWGLWPTLRFPSPLIKPDEPISGIRLSDWLHRKAHDGRPLIAGRATTPRHDGLRQAVELSLKVPDLIRRCQAHHQFTFTPSSKAHQKSGPFAPPALPGIDAPTAPSDSRRDHRPMRC
jgi:hypothetical protein